IQPLPTPPLPSEAPPLPGAHQMSPCLLFYPVLNGVEALDRVPDRKVVNPAPINRIDQMCHSINRLGLMLSEYLLEFLQQRRALFSFGA
ncbi:MAG: hypothetical protein WAT12_04705, partial [Candidatus Nitrotoga sp.]